MTDDRFQPRSVAPKFNMGDHMFCSGGSYAEPFSLWFAACHPDEPRLGSTDRLNRALKADLPMASADIGAACERLFGAPVPKDEREFPASADWVLTTPMERLYLMVRLPGDPLDRFGYGIGHDVMDRVSNLDAKARKEAEIEIEDALLETLKAIREEMLAPTSAPSPGTR